MLRVGTYTMIGDRLPSRPDPRPTRNATLKLLCAVDGHRFLRLRVKRDRHSVHEPQGGLPGDARHQPGDLLVCARFFLCIFDG